MTEILIAIFGVIGIIALAFVYSTFAWGLVTYKFWYWFILPIFPDLPEVTFLQCIGMYMFISLFHGLHINAMKKEYKDENAERWAAVIAPIVVLMIGWLVHAIFLN